MSCLNDKIKETIKNDDRKYITDSDKVVIPVTKSVSLQDAIKLAKGKIAFIEGQFKPKNFESPVSMTVDKLGVAINIHPSKELLNFYEEDYKEEPPRAQTDNYGELTAWKESQLKSIDNQINRVKLELKYNDTKGVRNRLTKLEKAHEKLIDDIRNLESTDSKFHAILDDLEDIKRDLNTDDIHDIDTIKNKIDWYDEFNKTLDSDEINAKIANLLKAYNKLAKEKTVRLLENDIQIQKTLKNLNENTSEQKTLRDLLVAKKDISKLNKYAYGLISNWTSDTVIPQSIMNNVMKTKNKHENRILELSDKLDKFNEQNKGIDRNLLIAKDEDGELTGWLTDLYSPLWYKELKRKNKLLDKHYKANTKTSYENLWNWHKRNTNIVNFFRLPEVKELYGEHPDYKEYFTYSDKEMKDYEDNLKSVLGPRYKDTVDTLLNKLEKFDEIKENETGIDVARKNIWEFTRKYLKGDPSPIEDDTYLLTGFNDLAFVAKKKTRSTKVGADATVTQEDIDTGFYSKDFQTIIHDNKLLQLWNIYREMSEYIDTTYNTINYGRLSYPKIEKELSERMSENLKSIKKFNYGKLGTAFHDTLHEFKGFFFEKGISSQGRDGIIPNKIDRSAKRFRDLKKAYILQGHDVVEAEKLSNKALLSEYSIDLDRNFKASLLAAAFHNARVEVEPATKLMFNYFKTIKDVNGDIRTNAIQRLEYYIDKVVLNRSNAARGSGSFEGNELPAENGVAKILGYIQDSTAFGRSYVRKHGLRLLSKQEKIIYDTYNKLRNGKYAENFGTVTDSINGQDFYFRINDDKYYLSTEEIVSKEKFDKAYDNYINTKLNSIGLSTNLAGLMDGLLKVSILQGLAGNIKGGIFNRIEGMHTNNIMDKTGSYWRIGNADVAKELMAFANLSGYSKSLPIGRLRTRHSTQIDIFRQFLKRIGGLQDRKDDLQKSAEGKSIFNANLDIYKWAITDPEFKNQGTVILSILMDEKIKDNEGNEHYLLDRDAKEFTPFTLDKEGILHIKPEFSNFSFESEQMQNLMVKASNAVSHSQGNFNPQDIMMMKKNVWGRILSLFKTWLPEAIFRRFAVINDKNGINVNLARGEKQSEGRYATALKANYGGTGVFALGTLGVSFGLLGGAGLIGGGILTSMGLGYLVKRFGGLNEIKKDADVVTQMATFIKSTLLESLNYPSMLLSSIPGMNRLKVKNTSYSSEKFATLSTEDIGALKAMSRELGTMLVLLAGKLAFGAMMFGDDDDDKRYRYNFVQNQFSKAINTLTSYSNPLALYNDQARIGMVSQMTNILKLVEYSVLQHDSDKLSKAFWKLTPLPSDLSKIVHGGIMPWEDKYNIDDLNAQNLGDLKWTQDLIKNIHSNGEFEAKKHWDKIRERERVKIMSDFDDLTNSKSILRIIANNIIKERYGKKDKGRTYLETVENINTSLDHVDRYKLKQSLIRKLNARGLPEKTVQNIVEKRFSDYN